MVGDSSILSGSVDRIATEHLEPRSGRGGPGEEKRAIGCDTDDPDSTGCSVLLVDSRPLTRDCLVVALESVGLESVKAMSSVGEASAYLNGGGTAGAILLNLSIDPLDEASLVRLVKPLRGPALDRPLLLLMDHADGRQAAMALRHGVRALLNRDLPVRLTSAAIDLVRMGWVLFPSDLMPAIEAELTNGARGASLSLSLTNRQREVLHPLQTGMANKDIASVLGISHRTVKTHVRELMKRFGVSNRTGVVARASQLLGTPSLSS